MKSKLLLISLFITFTFITLAQQQDVTRGQLFDLHYKANKALQAGNKQEALEIYKTILSVDANLPEPYLKMANIYATEENNTKSIAIAIALYNKYLSLKPNGVDAISIKNNVIRLQKLQPDFSNINLTEMLYIDSRQAQNVIATKARPGLNAKTKEEIVQQVEKVNNLYNKAEQAIENNKIEEGTQYLDTISENSELASPANAQAYSLLTNSYADQGNLGKMEDILTGLQNNIKANENMLEYYGYKIKDSTPFEDDICGIWVSDLSIDKNLLPYFVVTIDKQGDGAYAATILPYCTFSKTLGMYGGKPFEYSKTISKVEPAEHFADSYSDTIIASNNTISFNFGNEKFRKGIPANVAKFGIETTGELGKAAIQGIAEDTNNSNSDVIWATIAVQVGTKLIQNLFALASASSKKATLITTDIHRIFAGCAELNLIKTTMIENTTGFEKESVDTTQIKIHKLYPEYNIMFSDVEGELFGSNILDKDQIVQMDEYSHIQALKDKSYFNRESYKKLAQKVSNYCWSKAEEDPEMKTMDYWIKECFTYATKGLSYRKFKNANGYFEGWTNMSGEMNGWGLCRMTNGDEYVGTWNSNKFSGNGKFTKKDESGSILFEYTGTFAKNKSDGKGILRNAEMTYEGDFVKGKFNGKGSMTLLSGEQYDGTFENSVFKEGRGSFDGGTFTGKWKQIKKDDKKTLVPDGEGMMINTNGEKVFGKWHSGVFQNKKL